MDINLNDAVPNIIYKYREADNEEHLRIIENQELFFAPPSTFLDPYDCRFKIDRDFIKNENNRRKFYSKHYGLNNLNHPFIDYLIELNPVTDELIDEVELKRRKINDSLFGVFSASTTYRNNHLWSVFGKNHKGFCVGLDFKNVFSLEEGMKGKVQYVEEKNLPVSKVLNYDDINEFTRYAFELILTLPIKFIEEQEYRIQKIILPGQSRIKTIKKENIKSIILGSKMSGNKRNQIIDLISKNLPETSIIRLKYDRKSLKEVKIK